MHARGVDSTSVATSFFPMNRGVKGPLQRIVKIAPFVIIFTVCSSANSRFEFLPKFDDVQRPVNLNAATYLWGICWILILL